VLPDGLREIGAHAFDRCYSLEKITIPPLVSKLHIAHCKYYAILPSDGEVQELYNHANIDLDPVGAGFSYNSGCNPDFLSVDQLRQMITTHVDPLFKPL